MRKGLSTVLHCSPIPRLPGELVIADLISTRETGIPAHLGLFCLIVQPSRKVLFFMWISLQQHLGAFSVGLRSL